MAALSSWSTARLAVLSSSTAAAGSVTIASGTLIEVANGFTVVAGRLAILVARLWVLEGASSRDNSGVDDDAPRDSPSLKLNSFPHVGTGLAEPCAEAPLRCRQVQATHICICAVERSWRSDAVEETSITLPLFLMLGIELLPTGCLHHRHPRHRLPRGRPAGGSASPVHDNPTTSAAV